MKEFKGSPAPWRLDGGINQTGENTICLIDANNQVISDDIYYQEDANLIAAAPDLLESCIRMVNDAPITSESYEAYKLARAAISKALSINN